MPLPQPTSRTAAIGWTCSSSFESQRMRGHSRSLVLELRVAIGDAVVAGLDDRAPGLYGHRASTERTAGRLQRRPLVRTLKLIWKRRPPA